MKRMNVLPVILMTILAATTLYAQQGKNPYYSHTDYGRLRVSDGEWKKILPAVSYNILREEGTEPAFTGPYVHDKQKGTYYCMACGHPLFSSAAKFDSGTGWPSFFQPLNKGSVTESRDESFGTVRTAVSCARCGGHLGHVFDDGPKPTGLRYCMNGHALVFEASR